MSYKIKSLLYFVCFIASSVLYYTLEPEFSNKTNSESVENIKLDSNHVDMDKRVAELDQVPE